MNINNAVDAFVGETIDNAISSLQQHDDRVCINAFVEWENVLVELEYPKDPLWVWRQDCGSHSQHRWSAFDGDGEQVMQMVVKHCSCIKALIMQPMCKNCVHRATWRRPCDTPQNVFFVLAIADDVRCAALLEPMIRNRIYIDEDAVSGYQMFKPRPIFGVKTPNPRCRDRMRKLAWQVEQTAIAVHRQRKRMQEADARTSLQEIMSVQLPLPKEKMPVQLPEEKMPVQLPLPEEKMPVQLPLPEEKMPVQLPLPEEKMPVQLPLPLPEEKMPVQLPPLPKEKKLLKHDAGIKKKKKKKKWIEAGDALLSSKLISPVDREWS